MTALEFQGVTKRYGRRVALAGLDLVVPQGSVFGLVGSNGAGKTTSMSIAAGLVGADDGRIVLLGEGRFDPVRHAGRVAFVPQDTQLPGVARVRELLLFYGQLQGLSARDAGRCVDDILERVHLADRAASPLRTLSHGMRRRVMIAQALIGEPELILMDEPLSGLDPREAANARAILAACTGRRTIVISSHNLHEVEQMCDHVAFIEHGRRVRQDLMSAVTRRQDLLSFELDGAPVPLDGLADVLPEADLDLAPDGRRLTCRYDGASRSAAAVNAVVLRALLDAGVGVLEIKQGSALEQAYLDGVTAARPPPIPVVGAHDPAFR